MVVVPAGNFEMGSPDDEPERDGQNESPQHKVVIVSPFAVARRAVTRGQFNAFVSAKRHKTEGGARIWKDEAWCYDLKASWRAPGFPQDDNHPVVCINWHDAKAYAAWLSGKTGKTYRLLSEAEREYVTRAGTTTPFWWWGSSITPDQANYNYNFHYKGGGREGKWRKSTRTVDSFEANEWGLYNVHGNVWEWVEDCWHDSYQGAPSDGSAWTTACEDGLRVVRGGSWYSHPKCLRAAHRSFYDAGTRSSNIGFRLAMTL
jgi:formylglycine-generating enzyme required for sulfatase activity